MKLEQEIKTQGFKTPYHKLVVNLLFTGNHISTSLNQWLKPRNLTPPQYNILRILRGQHPKAAPAHLLQARMLDRMSNVSRLVEKLRLKGLVERKTSKTDRRVVDILITPAGLGLLAELDECEQAWVETFHEHLDQVEVNHLNFLLDQLRG